MSFFNEAKQKYKKYSRDYRKYKEKSQEREIQSLQREAKIQKLRTDVARSKSQQEKLRPKSYTFGGFAGPTSKTPNFNLGVGDALMGDMGLYGSKPKATSRKKRSKPKKRSSGKTIVVRVA